MAQEPRDREVDLLQDIQRRLAELEESQERATSIKRYAAVRVWVAYAILLAAATFFLIVFTPLGDWVGLKTGWVLPSAATNGVAAQQVNSDAVVAATRNMITVIAPIVLGVVIWLIAITAERRLKAYDETMQNFRGEIRSGMIEARETTLATVQGSIGEQVRNAVEAEKARLDEQIEEYRTKLERATEGVEVIRAGIEGRFGHIADTSAYAKSDVSFGELTSVGAVHKKVTEFFADGDRAQAITLVREMLDLFHRPGSGKRPSGSLKGEWFNLSAELGRAAEEGLALEVCLAGLHQQAGAPLFDKSGKMIVKGEELMLDSDLLAHAIKHAQTVNDQRLAGLVLLTGHDKDTCQGKPEWGWRTYSFTMKALDSLNRHEEAIELGHSFQDTVSLDSDTSKVLQTLMTIMAAHGDRAGAIALASDWLDNNPYAPAAQVITLLLDWLDADQNVDNYISLASRGIRDLAEEQASSNLANFYYRRALARDKRALDAGLGGHHPNLDKCEETRRALADYAMARKLGLNMAVVGEVIQREEVLRNVAEEQGCHVDSSLAADDVSARVAANMIAESLHGMFARKKGPDAENGKLGNASEANNG